MTRFIRYKNLQENSVIWDFCREVNEAERWKDKE